jgi:hypothetical protein
MINGVEVIVATRMFAAGIGKPAAPDATDALMPKPAETAVPRPKLLLYRPSVGKGSAGAGGVAEGVGVGVGSGVGEGDGTAGLACSIGPRLGGHTRGCQGLTIFATGWMPLSDVWTTTCGDDGGVCATQGRANPTRATGPVKIQDNFFIGTPFPSANNVGIRSAIARL